VEFVPLPSLLEQTGYPVENTVADGTVEDDYKLTMTLCDNQPPQDDRVNVEEAVCRDMFDIHEEQKLNGDRVVLRPSWTDGAEIVFEGVFSDRRIVEEVSLQTAVLVIVQV
jgi:hypothetical protein